MKKINISKIVLALVIGLFTTSCSEDVMDRIAENNNHSIDAQASLSITDAMTSTAHSTIGSSVDLYVGIYVEHVAGIENQAYRAEIRSGEPSSSTTNNNDWNAISRTIRNTKDIIKKCAPDGDEPYNPATLGIAKVLFAYNAAVYTDLFGDVPLSELGEQDERGNLLFMQPKIEKQEEIYKVIMQNLDEAEEHLKQKDKDQLRGQDLIYDGDYEKWAKVVPGLKARYKMRLLARAADKNKTCEEVIALVDRSFTSLADQFQFDKFDGGSNTNPHYGIVMARANVGASLSLIEKLIERDDPRVKNSFCDAYETLKNEFEGKVITDLKVLKESAFDNGLSPMAQAGYPLFRGDFGYKTPTILLSYYELLFLKAEALVRLGRNDEALVPLKDAIKSSMKVFVANVNDANPVLKYDDDIEITDEEAEAYLTNSVLPRFTENPLKEVMVQKYIAFWGANCESLEAYNDVRRLDALGEDLIGLKNPHNKKGLFPQRLPYGGSDVTTNAAIKDAFGDGKYIYTEKVWWAGGSR